MYYVSEYLGIYIYTKYLGIADARRGVEMWRWAGGQGKWAGQVIINSWSFKMRPPGRSEIPNTVELVSAGLFVFGRLVGLVILPVSHISLLNS